VLPLETLSGFSPLQQPTENNAGPVAHAAPIKIAVYHKENSNGTFDIKFEIIGLAALYVSRILRSFAT
jgi:hypothetical protein